MNTRFVQGLTCMCDVLEECHERLEGASTVGTHESRSIEESKVQDDDVMGSGRYGNNSRRKW